jgi:diaminopimelate decarboxylase
MTGKLPLDWWQRADLCYQDGGLVFSGHSVGALADRFGTPSFVYSARRVKANLLRLGEALDGAGFKQRHRLHFAMKSNRFAPLLTFLKQTNLCGIDACSPQEVEHALCCGFSPEEISFTATSLSQADFDILARFDGLSMNCDSIHAIRNWGQRKPGSEIGIRINPAIGISRTDNEKLQYAGALTTKFGIYREQFEEALAVAKQFGLTVSEIHFHTGCGYLGDQLPQLGAVIESALWFIETAGSVERVNIGGGLGVPHSAKDIPLDLNAWAGKIYRLLGHLDIQLEVEPGEYLVKDAGLLLLSKTFLEIKQNTPFQGVNAGFNIAPEPAYYQLPFQPVPLQWRGEPLQPLTVVGNINEALDVWQHDAMLPDMQDQDNLALINSGAYSSSMASNHCMRGAFKEFLLF